MESAWIDGRLDWLGDWPGPDALFPDAVERGLALAFLYRDVSQLFFVGLSRVGGFDCEGFSHGHWVGTNRALGSSHGRYGDWWNCV